MPPKVPSSEPQSAPFPGLKALLANRPPGARGQPQGWLEADIGKKRRPKSVPFPPLDFAVVASRFAANCSAARGVCNAWAAASP